MRRMTAVLAAIATGGFVLGDAANAQYRDPYDQSQGQMQQREQWQQRQQRQPRMSRRQQEQRMQQQQMQRRDRLQQQISIVRGDDLIGMNVENQRGDRLGAIHDVVIHQPDGEIAYVVIERGGFLGMGEDFYAVPFHELQFSQNRQMLLTNLDARELEQNYRINADRWPHPSQFAMQPQQTGRQQQMQQPQQQRSQQQQPQSRDQQQFDVSEQEQDVDRELRWGMRDDMGEERSGMTEREDMRRTARGGQRATNGQAMWVYRLSELRGTEVLDRNNERAGSIEDFAINMDQGRVAYALVGDGWMQQEFVAVPYRAVQLDRREEAFVTDMTAQALAQAPRVDPDTDLADPRIVRQIDQYFGETQVFGFPGQQQQPRQWQQRDQQMRDQQWQRQPQQQMRQQRQQWQQQQMPRQEMQQQRGAQLRGQIQDVQQMNGSTVLRLRSQEGRTYEVQLDETVQVQVQPDGRAIIVADEITREGQPVSAQEIQQDQQMQQRQQMQQQQRGQQMQPSMLQGRIQQVQQQQGRTQLQIQDQQGQTYTAELGEQAELHVKQNGDVAVIAQDLSRNGQRMQLQPMRRDQQMQYYTIRGQVQEANQNQIQIQGNDGRMYTVELGQQTQVRATPQGQPAISAQRLTRDGQEVQFQDLVQQYQIQQQRQQPQQQQYR